MKPHSSIATLVAVCAVLVAISAAPLRARPWTNAQGQTIEAELVAVKGEVAVLKMANGKTYDVPLATLSAADQAYAKEQAARSAQPAGSPASPGEPSSAAAEAPSASGPSVFKELLDGKLVAVDGKRVGKYEMASEPEYYAFYFSASWCGPCKQFTPQLISFYKENPGAKKAFEVVFVSRDNSEDDMEEYMTADGMPWPAIRFRDVERMKEINRYAGKGIPCLVLVDREGKVVSDSYVDGQYRGPTAVMREMGTLADKKVAAAK